MAFRVSISNVRLKIKLSLLERGEKKKKKKANKSTHF